jgi:hypothetical protein
MQTSLKIPQNMIYPQRYKSDWTTNKQSVAKITWWVHWAEKWISPNEKDYVSATLVYTFINFQDDRRTCPEWSLVVTLIVSTQSEYILSSEWISKRIHIYLKPASSLHTFIKFQDDRRTCPKWSLIMTPTLPWQNEYQSTFTFILSQPAVTGS